MDVAEVEEAGVEAVAVVGDSERGKSGRSCVPLDAPFPSMGRRDSAKVMGRAWVIAIKLGRLGWPAPPPRLVLYLLCDAIFRGARVACDFS